MYFLLKLWATYWFSNVESTHMPRKLDLLEAITWLTLGITSLQIRVGEHFSIFPIPHDKKTKLLRKHQLLNSSEL